MTYLPVMDNFTFHHLHESRPCSWSYWEFNKCNKIVIIVQQFIWMLGSMNLLNPASIDWIPSQFATQFRLVTNKNFKMIRTLRIETSENMLSKTLTALTFTLILLKKTSVFTSYVIIKNWRHFSQSPVINKSMTRLQSSNCFVLAPKRKFECVVQCEC